MNLNDMKGAMPQGKKGRPSKEIIGLVAYNLIYCVAAYLLMNELNLSDMMRNAVIGVMTVISLALIIKTGVRVLPRKEAQYKGLIYMCVIAPIGVIADWVMRFM